MSSQLSDKIRVLVFPCGSEVGLELHRSLNWSTHIELFGGSSVASNHGQYVYSNYIDGLPYVGDKKFLDEINTVIKQNNIQFLIPAHDSVCLSLAENQSKLKCTLICSPVETCRICRSKSATYETFSSVLRVPKVYTDCYATNFPVFLKPDRGQGSKGIIIANSQSELTFFLEHSSDLLVMEYLPGDEYTIDCFTDRHGVLRFVGPRKRTRIINGISNDTEPIHDRRLNDMARIINEKLKFRGVWFFQAKVGKDQEFYLLEIAPRVAGAMGIHRNLGANLPLLTVFDFLNLDTEITLNNHSIHMDRALINRFSSNLSYENVYIDLDDTILMRGEVNIWVVAFIYQCHNRGIKVHLLSRHSHDIVNTLYKFRLTQMFDTINCLDGSMQKADFINEHSAIFIDDSFSERHDIARKKRIPTFDVNSIEFLLDWRH
jgi:hypothetical protein